MKESRKWNRLLWEVHSFIPDILLLNFATRDLVSNLFARKWIFNGEKGVYFRKDIFSMRFSWWCSRAAAAGGGNESIWQRMGGRFDWRAADLQTDLRREPTKHTFDWDIWNHSSSISSISPHPPLYLSLSRLLLRNSLMWVAKKKKKWKIFLIIFQHIGNVKSWNFMIILSNLLFGGKSKKIFNTLCAKR